LAQIQDVLNDADLMNLNDLQRKLIAAARAHPPAAKVPYSFEKRIIQRIKDLRPVDTYGLWAQALWRAAAPCVGIALLLTAWSLLSSTPGSSNPDLTQEFENTVMAAANVDQPSAEPVR
jgi:hypothetical protein